jgi:enamine deaminase RidA (YjgF/YER057c/UK114 family)
MREGRSRRARSAIGVASLPGNVTVEIEAVVAIRPAPDAPSDQFL